MNYYLLLALPSKERSILVNNHVFNDGIARCHSPMFSVHFLFFLKHEAYYYAFASATLQSEFLLRCADKVMYLVNTIQATVTNMQ